MAFSKAWPIWIKHLQRLVSNSGEQAPTDIARRLAAQHLACIHVYPCEGTERHFHATQQCAQVPDVASNKSSIAR